jgi:F0F1-type ATP synthase membrane subunit b/b'
MESLIAVRDILLSAIPTFILVWILYWLVSRLFLNPLQRVLRQRHESTEGLRQAAESRLKSAEQKTAEYQEALRAGAAEIYRQQEQERQKALERRTAAVQEARKRAEQRIAEARQEIERDTQQAKQTLAGESEQMAERILRSVLEPGAPASRAAGPQESRR